VHLGYQAVSNERKRLNPTSDLTQGCGGVAFSGRKLEGLTSEANRQQQNLSATNCLVHMERPLFPLGVYMPDIESMELVKQCHFVNLQYSTNFNSEVLLNSMILLRSLNKQLDHTLT